MRQIANKSVDEINSLAAEYASAKCLRLQTSPNEPCQPKEQSAFFADLMNYRNGLRYYTAMKNGVTLANIKDINDPRWNVPDDFAISKELAELSGACKDAPGALQARMKILAALCDSVPVEAPLVDTAVVERKIRLPNGEEKWESGFSRELYGKDGSSAAVLGGHSMTITGYERPANGKEGYFVYRNSWKNAPVLRIPESMSCFVSGINTVRVPGDLGYKSASAGAQVEGDKQTTPPPKGH